MNQKNNNSFLIQLKNFGIGPIVGMFISIFTVPVITRLLSPEEFGKSSLFSLIQTIFNLVVLLGIDQAYVRFYNDKKIDKKNLLYNCLLLPSIFCSFILFFTFVFKKNISIFMFGQYEPKVMFLFLFYLPSMLFNRFALLTIRMELRGKTYSFLCVFQQVSYFILLYCLLLHYERTFKSLVYSTIISSFLNTVFAVGISKSFFPINKITINKQLLKEIVYYGLPLVPASIFSWVMNSFDKVALRSWSTFEELGLYAAAFKIISPLNIVQTIFTTTFVPIAYKWYEDNVPNEKYEQISTITLFLMMFVFSSIIVFRNILLLLLGSEYRNTAEIFIFLLFNPVMYTVSETTSLGIGFSKKTIYTLYISIIAALINLGGNYLLVPKFGAKGAAISTCVCYITFFWSRTLFSRKLWFKFDISKYVHNIVLLICFAINMVLWKLKIIELLLFLSVMIYNGLLILKIYKEKKLRYKK